MKVRPQGYLYKAMRFLRRIYKSTKNFVRRKVLRRAKRRLLIELSRVYRCFLKDVCFIGITGSCGKTTTTELVSAILEKEGRVKKGSHANTIITHFETILGVSRKDRFCVNEVSAHAPGKMKKSAKLLKPQIGVVTHIGQDHYGNYRSLESTAAEKGKLVESLPVDGTAVLNADDPNVYPMRDRTKARVITYGLSENAMVRGENVSSLWPNRMSLDVCYEEKLFSLQTQFAGAYWAYAVLAAISTAIAAGVSPERAIEAVGTFEPLTARMSQHKTPNGVTFIRDDWKAGLWTFPACMEFMTTATANRKIMVIGAISDTPKSFYNRYRAVLRQALDHVDKIVFVGDHASAALKVHPGDDRIMAFEMLYEADAFLRDYFKAGDLVLLKGSGLLDHLHRIVLSQTDDIACWRENCDKYRFCDVCKHRLTPCMPADEVKVATFH
jgi:UDP-N-acetylmuramoyl-tripeptide--D-alanyl-D-alanine ligase